MPRAKTSGMGSGPGRATEGPQTSTHLGLRSPIVRMWSGPELGSQAWQIVGLPWVALQCTHCLVPPWVVWVGRSILAKAGNA